MPEKYKPASMSQEEWDNRKPAPKPLPPFEDPNEPDDFAEIFVANLNKNSSTHPVDVLDRMLDKFPEEKA